MGCEIQGRRKSCSGGRSLLSLDRGAALTWWVIWEAEVEGWHSGKRGGRVMKCGICVRGSEGVGMGAGGWVEGAG